MAGDGDAASAVDVAAAMRDGESRWSLDAAKSSAEFHVKHFWGAITVRGHFDRLEGEGAVGPDGTISGRLVIDAASLTTKNRKRDDHLRSPDFFDVKQHPNVVVSLRELAPTGPAEMKGHVAIEAAGRQQELDATVAVLGASPDAVMFRCELVVDRTGFDMTWSPLGVASSQARAVVCARFVRQQPTMTSEEEQ